MIKYIQLDDEYKGGQEWLFVVSEYYKSVSNKYVYIIQDTCGKLAEVDIHMIKNMHFEENERYVER